MLFRRGDIGKPVEVISAAFLFYKYLGGRRLSDRLHKSISWIDAREEGGGREGKARRGVASTINGVPGPRKPAISMKIYRKLPRSLLSYLVYYIHLCTYTVYIYIYKNLRNRTKRGWRYACYVTKYSPSEGYNFPGTTGSHRLLEKICKIVGR